MPNYRVWYRDIPEPLEFASAGRCSDIEILEQIFAHENIASSATPPAQGATPASAAPTVQELIAQHHLAPVRYTEDESEIQTIE